MYPGILTSYFHRGELLPGARPPIHLTPLPDTFACVHLLRKLFAYVNALTSYYGFYY